MTSWCSLSSVYLWSSYYSRDWAPHPDATRRDVFPAARNHISANNGNSLKSNYNGSRYNILSFACFGFSRLTARQIHGLQRIRGKITAQSGCVYHITSGKRASARENWNVASVDMYRVINTLQGCESCDRLLIPIIMHITLRHFQNIKFEYICFLSCDI